MAAPTSRGIRIRHDSSHAPSSMVTFTLPPSVAPSAPSSARRRCPTCNVTHPRKTVHLWLDDTRACIVSEGVLRDLIRAGNGTLPSSLQVVNVVNAPPALTLRGRDISQPLYVQARRVPNPRPLLDQQARAITVAHGVKVQVDRKRDLEAFVK